MKKEFGKKSGPATVLCGGTIPAERPERRRCKKSVLFFRWAELRQEKTVKPTVWYGMIGPNGTVGGVRLAGEGLMIASICTTGERSRIQEVEKRWGNRRLLWSSPACAGRFRLWKVSGNGLFFSIVPAGLFHLAHIVLD